MAILDVYVNLNIWTRWLHVLSAMIWLGHLYFLQFVYGPLQRSLDEKKTNTDISKLMGRSLWWFRWGAMVSLLSGLLLFGLNYLYTPGAGFEATPLFVDTQGITDRAAWILFGMAVAMVMWFNAWFVIWPAQKKLMRNNNELGEDGPLLVRRSHLAVRTNTILSG